MRCGEEIFRYQVAYIGTIQVACPEAGDGQCLLIPSILESHNTMAMIVSLWADYANSLR